MAVEVEELKKVMAGKTDEELYSILHGDLHQYTNDAIEAAQQEFSSRKLSPERLREVADAYARATHWKPAQQIPGNNANGSNKALVQFIKILVIIVIGVYVIGPLRDGYESIHKSLDKSGYLSHTLVMPVAMKPNWVVGEFVSCNGIVDSNGEMIQLDCGDRDNVHELSVTFDGEVPTTDREIITGKMLWAWRCQRRNESLVCAAPKEP